MKLKFVSNADNVGKFIAASDKTKENMLKNYKTQAGALREIFIGETASVIYTPLYCSKGRVYDAVLKKPLYLQKKDAGMEEKLIAATLESIGLALDGFRRRGWDTEVVVCDNNSTDRTAAIAREEAHFGGLFAHGKSSASRRNDPAEGQSIVSGW